MRPLTSEALSGHLRAARVLLDAGEYLDAYEGSAALLNAASADGRLAVRDAAVDYALVLRRVASGRTYAIGEILAPAELALHAAVRVPHDVDLRGPGA